MRADTKKSPVAIATGASSGIGLAQAFRRLGTAVELVHAGRRLLPKDEPEAVEVLRRQFEREGIGLHCEFRTMRAANGRLTMTVALKEVTQG